MIILTDNFDVVPGKMSEGLDWAKRLRAASKKAGLVGEKRWLLRSIINAQRFSIVTQFASLGDYEEQYKNIQNSEVQALIKEMGTGGWIAGTDRAISRILEED